MAKNTKRKRLSRKRNNYEKSLTKLGGFPSYSDQMLIFDRSYLSDPLDKRINNNCYELQKVIIEKDKQLNDIIHKSEQEKLLLLEKIMLLESKIYILTKSYLKLTPENLGSKGMPVAAFPVRGPLNAIIQPVRAHAKRIN